MNGAALLSPNALACVPRRRRLLAARVLSAALWAAGGCVLAAQADDAGTAATAAQQAVDAAKVIGTQHATNQAAAAKDGSSEATVRALPGYSASPPETRYYRSGDSGAQGKSRVSSCVGNNADAACAAVNTGTAARSRMALTAASPELAGRAAVDNPTAVLGTVAQTYGDCRVNASMTAPARYDIRSCTLSTPAWTTRSRTKTLNVTVPNCTPGDVVGRGRESAGPDWVEARALCAAASPLVVLQFEAQGSDGSCSAPQSVTLDLSQPVAGDAGDTGAGSAPKLVGRVRPHWFGSCQDVVVYAEGPGCSNGRCKLNVHFALAPPVQTSPWTGDLVRSVALDFEQPQPLASEVWTSDCGPLEASTARQLPDGTAPPLPSMASPSGGDTSQPSVLPSASHVPAITAPGAAQCLPLQSTCTDAVAIRVLSGESVTRPCWAWQNTYRCTEATTDSTCSSSTDQGCVRSEEPVCTGSDAAGNCLNTRFGFACKTAEATFTPALDCGAASHCADGSCLNGVERQPNTNFSFAIAQYQARVEAGKDLDADSMTIFKGADSRCHKNNFGLDNCCTDAAWISRCSADEQKVYRLREEHRCHEIGDYCSDRTWYGLCKQTTRTHCCFASLLGRIIQEQGRAQIGRGWGASNAPDCRGFTPQELQALDWSRFDLSEFYAQIRATPPSLTTGQDQVQGQQSSCYFGNGRC